MRRKVSRIDGQVPSPTPMTGTSLDSISVMRKSGCSAANRPATSHPAEPPPNTATVRSRSFKTQSSQTS